MKTDLVKGFKDYTGEEAQKRAEIKKIIVETFEKYGFEPAETPIIEREEFVKGENTQDEAVSDIFRLSDKGKRKLALRYELTFPLKRIMKNKKLPYKRYQMGPVFRDEPIAANRFRQFTQCDVDVIGSSIKDEVEIVIVTAELMKQLGIKSYVCINSRKILDEILDKEGVKEKDKEQVLREIDKIGKLSEKEIEKNLKKYKAGKVLEIFKKPESYFNKYKSYKDIEEIKKYCEFYEVANVKFLPSLARGLSYYNGTVFEARPVSAEGSLAGGGSYNFNNVQCTGISFGFDRICMLAKLKKNKKSVLIVSLNEDKQAIKIANELRNRGNSVSIFYGKPSKALEYANAYDIQQVIFVGAQEVKKKKFKVKDMKTGREKVLVLEKRSKKNVIIQRKGKI